MKYLSDKLDVVPNYDIKTVVLRHHTTCSDITGASCSKLTTSLVNVSLKFKTLIYQIHCYFLLEKCENLLQCKRFSHFFNTK